MSSSASPPSTPDFRQRVQRSQWLRELGDALDRADRLTADLAGDPKAAVEVAALRARIALVRATLALVRAGRAAEIDPNWMNVARQLAPLSGDPLVPGLPLPYTPSGTSPPPPKSSK